MLAELYILDGCFEYESIEKIQIEAARIATGTTNQAGFSSKTVHHETCLYNFDPHKPHFYIVKLGFTGVYIIFLISAQKHRLWVLIRTASSRRF